MEEQSKEPTGTFGTFLDIMKAGQKKDIDDDLLQEIIVNILSYLIHIDQPIQLKDLIGNVELEEQYFMKAFPVMLEQGMVIMEGEEVRLAPEIRDRL